MSLVIKNNSINQLLQVLSGVSLWVLTLLCLASVGLCQNEKWHISELSVSSQNNQVVLNVDELSYWGFALNQVKYQCNQPVRLYPEHTCKGALVDLMFEGKNHQVRFDSLINFNDPYWAFTLSSLDKDITISAEAETGAVQIELQQFEINDILKNVNVLSEQITGLFSGTLQFDINDLTLFSKDAISFSDLTYEYSDDVVFFGIGGTIQLDVDTINQKLTANININNGEMLVNQLYVDYSQFPIDLDISAALNHDSIHEIKVNIINQQSLSMQAHVVVNQQLEWLIPESKINVIDSHHLNQQILNSILGIYGFGNTQMSGAFTIDIKAHNNEINYLHLGFDDYYALNEKRKLQVDSLGGDVYWNLNDRSIDSHLQWQSLLFAGMPVNQAGMDFNLAQDKFNLLGEHVFPVFDGSIIIKELQVDSIFSESIGMELNAAVLPISLKLITEKLNWPIMSGTISGELPGMVKKGSVIEFLGALRMSVFEGDMLVENLSLERLFGVAPVIAADVTFNAFDLSLLTETFGFGQITGKLSGDINDLRITNWKTDRLDAHVYTVKTKGVKQTISQRAIENISSLGGIKGAISKTFLRFFDDFRYKRIELSCKLHNAVCQIGGMKNQENQFVIVEGGGIPKINIVGYVRTINWEEFMSRLLNANYDN